MFNKTPNMSQLTLCWQHQAWFVLSSCAFQGAAGPGCCAGMPRALLQPEPCSEAALCSRVWAGSWLSPAHFSGSTAVAACAGSPQCLAPGALPAAPHPRKDEAPAERCETFLPFSCQDLVTESLSPLREQLCCSLAFVPGALGLLCIRKCLFSQRILQRSGGFSLLCKGGHHLAGLHPGASAASSTRDCCWNWEGSWMGPCLGTSSRFGIGSWAWVAFCPPWAGK